MESADAKRIPTWALIAMLHMKLQVDSQAECRVNREYIYRDSLLRYVKQESNLRVKGPAQV
jgi:hypothetical protein